MFLRHAESADSQTNETLRYIVSNTLFCFLWQKWQILWKRLQMVAAMDLVPFLLVVINNSSPRHQQTSENCNRRELGLAGHLPIFLLLPSIKSIQPSPPSNEYQCTNINQVHLSLNKKSIYKKARRRREKFLRVVRGDGTGELLLWLLLVVVVVEDRRDTVV